MVEGGRLYSHHASRVLVGFREPCGPGSMKAPLLLCLVSGGVGSSQSGWCFHLWRSGASCVPGCLLMGLAGWGCGVPLPSTLYKTVAHRSPTSDHIHFNTHTRNASADMVIRALRNTLFAVPLHSERTASVSLAVCSVAERLKGPSPPPGAAPRLRHGRHQRADVAERQRGRGGQLRLE